MSVYLWLQLGILAVLITSSRWTVPTQAQRYIAFFFNSWEQFLRSLLIYASFIVSRADVLYQFYSDSLRIIREAQAFEVSRIYLQALGFQRPCEISGLEPFGVCSCFLADMLQPKYFSVDMRLLAKNLADSYRSLNPSVDVRKLVLPYVCFSSHLLLSLPPEFLKVVLAIRIVALITLEDLRAKFCGWYCYFDCPSITNWTR